MAQLSIGVIGYGIRSRVLIGALEAFDNARVTAVADTNQTALELAAGDHPGIEAFGDYVAMFDSGKVDAVFVESPPHTHAACSIEALNRGIHVLSDVPAVHTVEEGHALWDAGRRSRAVYSLGATTNFWAYVDSCMDMKQKGLLGAPFYMEAEYVADLGDLPDKTPWRRHYEPIRYCTHSLGPLLRWIDDDLAEVSCFSTGSHMHADPNDDDAMVAIFRTRSNVVVKLLTCFANAHPTPFHRYVCHGTRGYFEKTQPLAGGESQVIWSTKAIYGMNGLMSLPVRESRPELVGVPGVGEHGGADYLMIGNFLQAVTDGKEPMVNMREALRMTLPGIYALQSARAGGKLTSIAYPWD